MSGTFEQMDVPPTLVSFAVAPGENGRMISPEFKGGGAHGASAGLRSARHGGADG